MLVSCKHTKNTGWMRINEILWRSAHECDTTFGFRPIWGCAEIGFLEDHLLLIGCFKELQHTAGHMVLSTLCSIISFKQHPIASESLRGDGSTKSKTLDSWYTLHDDTLLTYHILSNSRMWVLTGRLLCWYNMKKMKKWESSFIFLCRGNTSELLGHIIARWALQPTPAYHFTLWNANWLVECAWNMLIVLQRGETKEPSLLISWVESSKVKEAIQTFWYYPKTSALSCPTQLRGTYFGDAAHISALRLSRSTPCKLSQYPRNHFIQSSRSSPLGKLENAFLKSLPCHHVQHPSGVGSIWN